VKAVIRLKQLAGKPIKFDFVGDENGEVCKAIKEGLPLWRPWKDDKKAGIDVYNNAITLSIPHKSLGDFELNLDDFTDTATQMGKLLRKKIRFEEIQFTPTAIGFKFVCV
jgi:hypothetical protein